MADSRFTALGLSGSGKTCYILGMYHEMSEGLRKFELKTTNEVASKLEAWMDQLDDEEGMERFPAGTAITELSDYRFKLSYQKEPIMSFIWADYGGRALRERENSGEVFLKISNSIEESTALYIFIDGDLLCEESQEDKIKNVKRKCARTVNSYITDFAEAHDGNLPPIVFVVTKADLCSHYLKNDKELNEIIEKSFGSVFGKGFTVYIVAVSLGKEISDDNYSGEVEPVNIHIPFFIGCYHEFLNFCIYLKSEIESANENSQKLISESQSSINHENSRWFFTNYDRIDSCKRKIAEANENIASNQELLSKYRRLLGAVVTELAKCSNDFSVYQNGTEVDFSADDAYGF